MLHLQIIEKNSPLHHPRKIRTNPINHQEAEYT